jgi:predicted nucleic acid-binding Zn ribbon protein
MTKFPRPPGRLTPISEIIGASLSRGFLHFTARRLRVFELWPQVVGPADAARTRARFLRGGRLIVLGPGPAWLDRFTYKKADWLRGLNRELGDQAALEEIILKVGDFQEPSHAETECPDSDKK